MAQDNVSTVRHGVVGIVYEADRFLVIRRSMKVRAPGLLCFPGGHIESGESFEEAKAAANDASQSAKDVEKANPQITPQTMANIMLPRVMVMWFEAALDLSQWAAARRTDTRLFGKFGLRLHPFCHRTSATRSRRCLYAVCLSCLHRDLRSHSKRRCMKMPSFTL